MVIADKFRGGDKRRAIAAADMRKNEDIRDRETGIWIRRQQQRRGTGDRSDRDGEQW